MKLDDFNALSDEEKSGLLSGMETDRKTIEDLTAERDSFKTENAQLQSQIEQANKELKATKEVNFSLARKVSVAPKQDLETQIYNFMKGF